LYLSLSVPAHSEIYFSLSQLIDHIGPETTGPALLALSQNSLSIQCYGHTITLINEIVDSLFFCYPTRRLRSSLIPFWRVRYNEVALYCFDPRLSSLLTQLLPSSQIKYLLEPQERVDLRYAVAWQMSLGRWE